MTAPEGPLAGLLTALDLTVVAEGVEDDAQLEWLQEQRCDYVQGYLLSRPLPAAAVSAFRVGTHAPVA